MLTKIIKNKSRILLAFALIILLILTFYLGYTIATKDQFQAKFVPEIQTKLDNGSGENSLTQIQIRDIIGSSNSKDNQSFGKFYYVVKPNKESMVTDILLKIDQAPIRVLSADEKTTRNIPLDMNVDLALKTPEGLDFEYQNIGKIKFVIDDKKVLKADFSSIIPFSLDDKSTKIVQRIVFRPVDQTLANIFQDTNPNLPVKVRGDKSRGIGGEPAPYFWVEI